MKQVTDINNSFYIQVLGEWSLNHNQLKVWEELVKQQPNGTFFLSYDWLNLWWLTFAQSEDILKLILIHDEDKLIAICPFYLKKGHVLHFIGTGEDEASEVCSEYLDIIIANDYKDALLNTVQSILHEELNQIEQMTFSNVLYNSYIVQLMERSKEHYIVTKEEVGVRYVINLPSDYLSYETTRSKSFISQANRKRRKFEKLGGEIINADTLESANEIFNQLAMLHNARWNAVGLTGAFTDKRFLTFHRDYITILLKQNQLSMKALIVNKRIVGVIYNIIYNDNCYFYQIGIDINDHNNISLGTLLHLSEIKGCIQKGYKKYDFMKGEKEKSYKQNFTSTTNEMISLTVYKKGFRAYIKNASRHIIKKIKGIKNGR